MEQRSIEWFSARLGKVTASKINDVISKTKSGYSSYRASYMMQLLAEIVTNKPVDNFVNAAMQHGIDFEPEARQLYELHTGNFVTEVGFYDHPTIDRTGASPDGLVGSEGLIEIKCPSTVNHLATVLEGKMPDKHMAQIQWQMACTGRKWCDFVSYDPRIFGESKLFIITVPRDDVFIENAEKEVIKFLSELDLLIEKLGGKQ